MPIQATLTKEVSISVEGDYRLLALLGDDANLDLAFLYVEDRITGVSLREDLPILLILRNGPPPATVWRNTWTSKGRFFIALAILSAFNYSLAYILGQIEHQESSCRVWARLSCTCSPPSEH
jgi:hypothetical protein